MGELATYRVALFVGDHAHTANVSAFSDHRQVTDIGFQVTGDLFDAATAIPITHDHTSDQISTRHAKVMEYAWNNRRRNPTQRNGGWVGGSGGGGWRVGREAMEVAGEASGRVGWAGERRVSRQRRVRAVRSCDRSHKEHYKRVHFIPPVARRIRSPLRRPSQRRRSVQAAPTSLPASTERAAPHRTAPNAAATCLVEEKRGKEEGKGREGGDGG